jgi:hypothetical protein
VYGLAALSRATSREMLQTYEAVLMANVEPKEQKAWLRRTRQMGGL